MNKLMVPIAANGKFIPLTSLVWITFGINAKGIILTKMLESVPKVPQRLIDSKSKLKSCETKTVPKNCLIRYDSGLTLKYIAVKIIEIISAKKE